MEAVIDHLLINFNRVLDYKTRLSTSRIGSLFEVSSE